MSPERSSPPFGSVYWMHSSPAADMKAMSRLSSLCGFIARKSDTTTWWSSFHAAGSKPGSVMRARTQSMHCRFASAVGSTSSESSVIAIAGSAFGPGSSPVSWLCGRAARRRAPWGRAGRPHQGPRRTGRAPGPF